MRRVVLAALLTLGLWRPVAAETVAGPDRSVLDEAVRLGTVAALAPLCGLRAERWSFDLRRAAILQATRGSDPSDAALRQAPGSASVVGALSFAESEALENFADAPVSEICEPLKIDPELARADEFVRAFRELRSRIKPAS